MRVSKGVVVTTMPCLNGAGLDCLDCEGSLGSSVYLVLGSNENALIRRPPGNGVAATDLDHCQEQERNPYGDLVVERQAGDGSLPRTETSTSRFSAGR
jgi:hypothetical protein